MAESQILALLAADASEYDIAHSVAELVASADDGERDRIAQLGRYAAEIQAARADDRRRARGLTALSETAADLAGHRNVDELLTAICRRARLLLATDVAYITLRDARRGDTYVHTTDGIVSETFRTMRLANGLGLGGLVAQTGQPEATADYTRDERLAHSRDVDRRVVTEGLRAIVAAPLTRGAEIIGVLLSGSREVRQFDPTEVALFASLATHAAIALENARLSEGSKRTLADLERAHEALQRHAHHVERVDDVYAELAGVALDGGGIDDLLQGVVRRVPGRVELHDPSGRPLSSSTSPAWSDPSAIWLQAPVLAGPDQLGLVRLRSSEDRPIATELLQRTASLIAGILLSQRAQTEAEHRHRSILLEELLAEHHTADPELHRRAVRAGIPLDRELVVLVIDLAESAKRWAWMRAVQTAQRREAVVGTVGGRIVAIEPGPDATESRAAWGTDLRGADGMAPTIGAAGDAIGAEGLRTAYRDAVRALNLLLALGRTGTSATIAELGFFGTMIGHAGANDLRVFLQRTLGPVIEYDRERGADLLTTLEAVLSQGGHLANSARTLGIHINTLYQRLERLDQILGDGWRESDRRLELHLAVRLHALEHRLERPV
ncbi:MAG TPA: helix-turn-helix domain-containing protein [Solirubrobacteraceae bacterium]|nr:helix-turn-helix domain-containing protein [Solirubrobacteraceae bacterium]